MTVYLYRAVWNNALKYLRDRNVEEERLKHWFEEEGEMSEENFYSVVREELFRKLRELIDRLPEERKNADRQNFNSANQHTVNRKKSKVGPHRSSIGEQAFIAFIFGIRGYPDFKITGFRSVFHF